MIRKFSFQIVLEKDGSASMHNRILQVLATEMFKINRDISSSFMKGIFEPRAEHPYNLRCISLYAAPLWRREDIFFRGKHLEPSSRNFRNIDSSESFKISIKK